jgi:uncharacterized protein
VFISGGGTMNREAGLLGVPVYSIFTGRKPYLDEYLAEKGKLTFIDSLDKIDGIKFLRRDIDTAFVPENPELVVQVVDQLLELCS